MDMFLFIKHAGEQLLSIGEAKATEVVAKVKPTSMNVDAANLAAANAIVKYVAKMNLTAQDLVIYFDGVSSTVIAQGTANTQEDKEKILLCCGNVAGVERVQDQLGVVDVSEANQPMLSHPNNIYSGQSLRIPA